ncbi:CLUMA_CG007770, isoform A [Clunio marinus]|uniref:CLUMA_CG007770, isoform A n=1 Tax=Clunio marinus TaxID=568069 RepID=A0A1J1I1N9_9DIPT|nr:CLUMA_CG007770, isoform A [Clunio marinus]
MSMMKLIALIYFFLLCFEVSLTIFRAPSDSENESNSYRIYNGLRSMQFSYTVKIFSREDQKTLSGFSCSGSIIHPLWIITAAHCVYDFKVFDVFIGNVTNDVNHVVRPAKTFIHPNYTFETELLNDLALLKLKRSLETLNNTFELVSLPQASEVEKSFVGLQGIVAGYGRHGD